LSGPGVHLRALAARLFDRLRHTLSATLGGGPRDHAEIDVARGAVAGSLNRVLSGKYVQKSPSDLAPGRIASNSEPDIAAPRYHRY
jgi:hypothetical protein